MLCKRGVDGFFQLLLLIEAGNHDRNERRAGKRRRGIMGRPVPLPVKPEIEAACHPQRRHEQRIEEYEIEQESPRRDEGYSGEAPHHEQADSESSETFDHLKGYQAEEMTGRIVSLSGWHFRNTLGERSEEHTSE